MPEVLGSIPSIEGAREKKKKRKIVHITNK
jgi:hypothetical protein